MQLFVPLRRVSSRTPSRVSPGWDVSSRASKEASPSPERLVAVAALDELFLPVCLGVPLQMVLAKKAPGAEATCKFEGAQTVARSSRCQRK